METEGTDEPEQGAPTSGPLPPPADAPRPATGPTTGGIPTGGAQAGLGAERPDPEPITVGDPSSGATSTARIEAPSPASPLSADAGATDGPLSGDWPAQATDAVINVVGAVRDRTTGPITTAARGVVFGLLAGILGIAVAVLVIILAIRLLDEALPSGVWVAYLVLGALFVLIGALVFHKRKPGNTATA
jgi:hypothetical protein